MMKKISLVLVAVFLVGALAYAAAPAIEGTVQNVKHGSITVQVGSEAKTFTFDKGLKFTVDGKTPASVSVKAGDTVSIVADKHNVAEKIDVKTKSATSTGSN